jgi:hypothetical protein
LGKLYPVGIVGESKYQPAIRRCFEGDPVNLVIEAGNPHDPKAVAVVSHRGETIGYIGRDSFVRSAIHTQGKWPTARIKSISSGGKGQLGVVLNVDLNGDEELSVRQFVSAPARAQVRSRKTSKFEAKLYGILALLTVVGLAQCVGPHL